MKARKERQTSEEVEAELKEIALENLRKAKEKEMLLLKKGHKYVKKDSRTYVLSEK